VGGTAGKNTAGSELGSTCKCMRRNVDNSCMVKKLTFFIISGILEISTFTTLTYSPV
jgi:hypothetical protein